MSESMNNYKSPIEVFIGKVQEKIENEVITTVQNVGIKVNKEELQKALVYDRKQYELGYEHGKWDAQKHGYWINDFGSPLKCSSCGIVGKANEITLRTDFKFCPYCGAKMDEVTE